MNPASWWWALLRRARPQAGQIGVLIALTITGIGFNLLKPWPLKLIVDYILPGRNLPPAMSWLTALPGGSSPIGTLAWLTASTVLVFLCGWVNTLVARYVQIDAGGRMTYGLAAEAFAHLQNLSLRFHSRRPTGDLVKRVAVDCRCIRELVLDVMLPALNAAGTLLAILCVMWPIDPALALLALAVIPPLGILTKIYLRRLLAREADQAEAQGQMMAEAEQALAGLPVIQAFGREPEAVLRFSETTQRVGRSYCRSISMGLQYRMLTSGVVAMGTALVLVVGGRQVLAGGLLLGDMLLLVSYLTFLYAPLETMSYLSTSLASAAAGARRVFELMESKERILDAPDAVDFSFGQRIAIELEDVEFGYDPEREVLHHINLSAAQGQTIALVGPTGAGKTTVVSLILRLFDPNRGRVKFNGVDIRKYRVRSVRENVAIVLQDPFLLPMTVAENIAYARPNASRKEVIEAARAAHSEEFIEKLPDGYDTVIGERGATLSGGQRQRLAIARAFLKDAPVLILDEPTSALDTQTEALVLDATYRLMKGRTTFIIGHRLSTVARADKIVVLDRGTVVETGTHKELMEAGGLYQHLYSIQFGELAVRRPDVTAEKRSSN